MNMNRFLKFLVLSCVVAVSGVLVACGGVPSGSVATVADANISKTDFNKWMAIAAKSQGQQNPGAAALVLNPPDFKECIASKKASAPKATAKAPAPTDAALKSECQAQFDSQKGQVMQLLITSAWIKGQAAAMGVSVSDKEVRAQFEKTKKSAFPTDAGYQKFLKQSGETEDDILYRIKIDALSTKIRDAALKGTDKVSDADAQAYYASHQQQFGQPEKRDLLIIRTSDKAQADAAKKALESGQAWAAVAKQYSNDPQTKSTGGVVKGAVKGQQDPAVDKAAFAGDKDKAYGPIHGSLGWYIVKITGVTKGTTQPLNKVRAQIDQVLKAQTQQTALQNFVKDFQKSWKNRTECAKLYIVDLCKNAPKQAAQPAPGTVQQAPPTAGG